MNVVTSGLPDIVVLKAMDHVDLGVIRTRIAQGRERFERLHAPFDVVRSNQRPEWSWYTRRREFIGVACQAAGGTRLSFGATSDLSFFSFTDRTLELPVVDDGGATASAYAQAMLDRFEEILDVPTVRQEQLRPIVTDPSVEPQPVPAAAAAYAAALDGMVDRFAAMVAQWGDPERLPKHVRVTPPTLMAPGDLVSPLEGRSVLTREGMKAVSHDVPRALHLACTQGSGYDLSHPENDASQHAVHRPDAMAVMRAITTLPSTPNGPRLLAPRLRRR